MATVIPQRGGKYNVYMYIRSVGVITEVVSCRSKCRYRNSIAILVCKEWFVVFVSRHLNYSHLVLSWFFLFLSNAGKGREMDEFFIISSVTLTPLWCTGTLVSMFYIFSWELIKANSINIRFDTVIIKGVLIPYWNG